MSPVDKGNTIVFPAPTEENKAGHRVVVHWQQSFSSKDADYYVLVGHNKTQG